MIPLDTPKTLPTPFLLAIGLWLAACATEKPSEHRPAGAAPPTTAATSPDVHLPESLSPSALAMALEKKDFLLIRLENPTPDRIPGTDASLAHDDATGLAHLAGADLHRPVVLYCRTVPKARHAAALLRERGYTRVSVLDGGITAWKVAGLPVGP